MQVTLLISEAGSHKSWRSAPVPCRSDVAAQSRFENPFTVPSLNIAASGDARTPVSEGNAYIFTRHPSPVTF